MKIDETMYSRFKEKLEAVSGQCFRVKNPKVAYDLIKKELQAKQVRSIAMVESPIINAAQLIEKLEKDFEVYTEDYRKVTSTVDVGITEVKWGIAELGTVVQTAVNVDERLTSMLPSIHIALVPTRNLLPTIMDALSALHQLPEIPGFVGFITGPSRTSDIERVLTIGVHGPEQLMVIFIDEPEEVA